MKPNILTFVCLIMSIIAIALSIYSISMYKQNKIDENVQMVKTEEQTAIDGSLVGTYKGIYNGRDAVIALYEDNKFILPNGYTGVWYIEGREVVCKYEPSVSATISEVRAIIVDKGLILGGIFYQKI